jgi:hypothetical protein
MTQSYLYIAYSHNFEWEGNRKYRRHWAFLLTQARNEVRGTIYDVVDSNQNGIWEKRKRVDYDITFSATYENKVIMGRIDSGKIADFEKVIDDEDLPEGDERCQDWMKRVVESLIKEGLLWSLARTYITQVPST